MFRPPLTSVALLAGFLSACTLRCGDNTFPEVVDGGDDAASTIDASDRSDAPPALTSVDFAIGGCDSIDETGCSGVGPLTLSFAAITTSPVQVYLWQFGDGSTSRDATPTHTYVSPGSYTVSLDVEGPGGGLGETKTDWISVAPGLLGSACGTDQDCASGTCVCGDDDPACAAPLLRRGLCTSSCAADVCAEGACISLGPGAPTDPQDWQAQLCLPNCDAGCPTGLECRDLLGEAGELEPACFVSSLLAEIGESCIDASGVLRDDRCASGSCVAVGARGLCAADCTTAACPSDTTCATFGGALGAQCVRVCDSTFTCASDPFLACEAPGNGGNLGFVVNGVPAPDGYCTPRFCGDDASVCDPAGVCVADYCEAP